MSVFGTIMSKIFGAAAAPSPAAAPSAGATPAPEAAPETLPPATADAGTGATMSSATSAPPQATGPAGSAPVDVAAILTALAAKHPEKLDWRHSIVDLMKLLGMDSSLSARKELAHELQFSGDTNDSAAMNIWLQKQVMTKLAENGGKVPDELKH